MAISKKIDTDELSHKQQSHAQTYSTRYFAEPIPKFEMPESSLAPDVAYRLCRDELYLDGNPHLNLASFVTTWMEPEAIKLITESLDKNFVDRDEYPQSHVIQNRCVNMLARLYNAPDSVKSVGTSTIGSSEAIMLASLSHKWNWRKRREAEGKDARNPNIVMGADVQIVWDKFARYFDVEARIVPMKKGHYTLDPKETVAQVDDNTICVVGVLGTTFTGQLDPISEINDELIKLKAKTGLDVPLHVDAASGGFVTPFIDPDLKWDFRLEQVRSINVSGHKYGLVYPGIGWVIWRDESDLANDLVFNVNYLGGDMPTFNLNFSRGASHVIAQYYNFLRLGKEGYRRIMENLMENARFVAGLLKDSKRFELLSEDHTIPVVVAKLKHKEEFTVFDISEKLRHRGWIVPAYTLPKNAEDIAVLRIVLREGFSRDMAELLTEDIMKAVSALDKSTEKGKHVKHKHHRVC